MTKPFLSIITISFNQCDFLRQTIESVLSQKSDDVEYIVVDPGSTDGSRELLLSYGGAIDHLVLEKDAGPGDGLNKGFARATGEIGYFVNSDDFILPGAISRLRAAWKDLPDTDILLCGSWKIDGNGQPIRELQAGMTNLAVVANGHCALVQQGMSFKMDLFRKIGGFNLANKTCWDIELLGDMLAAGGKVAYSKTRIGVFRVHGGSLTGGVAGPAHVAKFQADRDRMLAKFASDQSGLQALLSGRLARYLKYVIDPMWAFALIADKALPARMRQRFTHDLHLSLQTPPATE